MALLISTAIVSDIQGVALSPMVGTMASDLSLSSAQVSWALNIFNLAGAISVGLTSRLGDLIGHRKVVLWLGLVGLCGAILAALSDGFLMLLIGRAMLGFAVTTPLAWGLLRARARAEQVQSAASWVGTVTLIFTSISLLLGGALVAVGARWQAIFWVIAVAYLVMLVLILRAPETPSTTRARVALDWPGTIGLGIWLAALLLAVSQGGSEGWGSPYIVTLLGIFAIVLIGWLEQQRRAASPLMDFKGMDVRQLASGFVAVFTSILASFALFILLPVMLQMPVETGYGRGAGHLEATLPLIMILPGSLIAASLGKTLLTRWGPRVPMVIGGLAAVAAFLGLSLFCDEMWLLYLWVFVYAIGIIICYTLGWSLVAASGRKDNTSITFGVMVAGQMVTAAITNAVVLAVLNLGASTLPTASVFTWLYASVSIVALVFFVFFGLLVVPRRLEDRHAVS